jgi:hypothetical protein
MVETIVSKLHLSVAPTKTEKHYPTSRTGLHTEADT